MGALGSSKALAPFGRPPCLHFSLVAPWECLFFRCYLDSASGKENETISVDFFYFPSYIPSLLPSFSQCRERQIRIANATSLQVL